MTITEDRTIMPETPAETVFYGWEVYRRSQQIPWPMTGGKDVLKCQSLLFQATEPFASGRHDLSEAQTWVLSMIRLLTGDLIDALRRYCGPDAAAFASGQDGSVAA